LRVPFPGLYVTVNEPPKELSADGVAEAPSVVIPG
jgi:hypothetical protein